MSEEQAPYGNIVKCSKCGSPEVRKKYSTNGATIYLNFNSEITDVKYDQLKMQFINYVCMDCGEEFNDQHLPKRN
jgi:DNA-directed RNA polymerase subunit RPC12/RpoP